MTKPLGPVGDLLQDPDNWTQMRDCGTVNNRLTKPLSPEAVTWSLRAAMEKFYPEGWKEEMDRFMTTARKHYPGYTYQRLHSVLSHEALIALLRETGQ